jgi:hypothetical protein
MRGKIKGEGTQDEGRKDMSKLLEKRLVQEELT